MDDGGWVTLCEDVTERHRMERELRLQYERFDQAINHMSHGLCMFGPDERLIVCNAQYLKIYGLDPAVVKPGVHASRAARALDRERQRARHVGRGVLREAQARGRRRRALDHAAAPEGRARDRGDLAPDAGRRLGLGARGRHRAARLREGAARAEHPVRRRAGEHGARPVRVRQGLARDRAQPALSRALRPRSGRRAARHAADRADAPEHRRAECTPRKSAEEFFADFIKRVDDRPRAGGASPA